VTTRRGAPPNAAPRRGVSYELLDEAEKVLVERCSVFAGGFNLESARAVAGFDDLDD
jgi:predicted ATPase